MGLYEVLHGSALFTRGQTQVLSTLTFDSPFVQESESNRSFLLHYTFPAYSTNSLEKRAGRNRREIGHAALAERALRPILPQEMVGSDAKVHLSINITENHVLSR